MIEYILQHYINSYKIIEFSFKNAMHLYS